MAKRGMTYEKAIQFLVELAMEEYQRQAVQANLFDKFGLESGRRAYERRKKIIEAVELVKYQKRMEI